jgi:uncharacterized membrane protein YjjP (DUF1212 family)
MKFLSYCKRFLRSFIEENPIETIGYVVSLLFLAVLFALLWGTWLSLLTGFFIGVALVSLYGDIKSYYRVYGKYI